MNNTNTVVIIGNMTRDVGEGFGYIGNGTALAKISLAVNSSKKDADGWKDEANYFDVEIWGKEAEALKPYLTKGQKLCVTGSLRQDRWEKDGQKYSRVKIVSNHTELVGGRRDADGTSPYTIQQTAAPAQDPGFIPGGEDIPF